MTPLSAAALSAALAPQTGPPALGVCLPAGWPSISTCALVLERAVRDAGAHLIILAVPCVEPHLDGPLMRQAHASALGTGIRRADVLGLIQRLAPVAPVVATSYYRPVLAAYDGTELWAQDLARAGAAGAMIVDLPEDEAPNWHAAAAAYGLHTPRLLSRAASETRIVRLAQAASGWLCLPAADVPAPSGYRGPLDIPALADMCARVRLHGGPPLVVGGGISTPQLAAQLAPIADGLLIGTPLARELMLDEHGPGVTEAAVQVVTDYQRAIRAAVLHDVDEEAAP